MVHHGEVFRIEHLFDSDANNEEDDNEDMHGIVDDLEEYFLKQRDLFESMLNDDKITLFYGCTSFTKLSFLVTYFF